MGGLCDYLIKQDIGINCDDLIVPGIEANGVIMNRYDVDFEASITDDMANNVIKTIVLNQGKKAYSIYVPQSNAFNNTTTTMEKGTNRNTFTNDLGFVVLDNDPDVCKNIIDQLANGKFIAIYENKFKNLHKLGTPGDSSFQIVGWYQGLIAETLENNKYSADTDGGWNVLLKETKCPKSGIFLYNTSYSITKQQLQTLLNPQ